MKVKPFLLILFIFQTACLAAQNLTGHVHEVDLSNEQVPLVGASVFWAGTSQGVATDADGFFSIAKPGNGDWQLVISFVGYTPDTLIVRSGQHYVEHLLSQTQSLEGVTVVGSQPGSHFDRLNPIQTQFISSKELKRAACCNLSESFETNASVDVQYSDALSGAKQIQLLGLAGVYSQIQTENIPAVRGLASAFGLGYIPGSWMESIQVSKGTASVANGYESITGQINVEYKKPWGDEKLFVGSYANSIGMLELNTNYSTKVGSKFSAMILAHVEKMGSEMDHNHDSFLDHPLVEQVHLFNRWKYQGENLESQVGIKYLHENRNAGQTTEHQQNSPWHFGIEAQNRRLEGFFKMGYIFKRPATSLGFIGSFAQHEHNAVYGQRPFDAQQQTYTGNLVFITYIGSTNHTLKTGANLNIDNVKEQVEHLALDRAEAVPGIYAEYSYKWMDDFTLMAGFRYDHHNLFGNLYTPRFHMRYRPVKQLEMRVSAGKGYRAPVPLSENLNLLASSRQIIASQPIAMEEAWNYGVNATQRYQLAQRELTINTEFYRTQFVSQLVIDVDSNPAEARLINSTEPSYSNSFQIEASYAPWQRIEVTAAYRLNDVKQTLNGITQDKPLVSRYKGLFTLGYKTPLRKWQFDYTLQLNGGGRLPNTSSLPTQLQMGTSFPAFVTMNLQITKLFRKWEVYLGMENIGNYIQQHPIVDAGNPFGPYFDASMVWGPLTGRKVYAGFRMAILNQ